MPDDPVPALLIVMFVVAFVVKPVELHACQVGCAWVVTPYIEWNFAGMEASRAEFYLACMLVCFSNLVLVAVAGPIGIERFVCGERLR